MSKQLSISATLAVLSMSVLAVASALVGTSASDQAHVAASAPLIGYEVLR